MKFRSQVMTLNIYVDKIYICPCTLLRIVCTNRTQHCLRQLAFFLPLSLQ